MILESKCCTTMHGISDILPRFPREDVAPQSALPRVTRHLTRLFDRVSKHGRYDPGLQASVVFV